MIAVGIIQRSFGLNGEFKVWAEGITIEKLNLPVQVFIGSSVEDCEAFTLEMVIKKGKSCIGKLSEVKEVEDIKALQGKHIFIEDSLLPQLEEGTFYQFDLEGLTVLSKDKIEIGKVVRVYNFPSTDCLEVECSNGKSFMIPLVKEAIISIDLKSGYIIVDEVFLDDLL